MVDNLSDLMFAPTETSRENLLREGKDPSKIFVTGNTEIDALKMSIREGYTHPELAWLAPSDRLVLMTAHRRENLGEPMRNIFRAVRQISEEFPDVKFIYPMHMNPAVREVAQEILGDCGGVRLIDQLGVTDFFNFTARAHIVLTDSGGVQEGAPALGKPVLVARDTTERPEGVAAGTLRLVGTEEAGVYAGLRELLTDAETYSRMSRAVNPYGDGSASRKIADGVLEYFGK
jgi:UDP-N-acetylglucosamine 2-epimerase (non-hydrolysing)